MGPAGHVGGRRNGVLDPGGRAANPNQGKEERWATSFWTPEALYRSDRQTDSSLGPRDQEFNNFYENGQKIVAFLGL